MRLSVAENRFELDSAFSALDAANAEDPNVLLVQGIPVPRALHQGLRASHWLERLGPTSTPVQLAARAHHVRRWVLNRSDYPDGRVGYHRWKREARELSKASIEELLEPVGLDPATIRRVGELVARENLGSDPETQRVEDVACLVFLETQYDDLIDRLGEDKVVEAVRKTLRKMSSDAIALAGDAVQSETGRALLQRVVLGA